MNEATIKVIEEIANDILRLAKLVIDNVGVNAKTGKNTLKESALKRDLKIEANISEPVIINALFNNYVSFLEWDRPPNYGKMPPIDSLRDWALSRGISTDNSTLFAIAKAIQRDGHEGRPILATLDVEIEKAFDNGLFDKLFEAIIDEITKFFN